MTSHHHHHRSASVTSTGLRTAAGGDGSVQPTYFEQQRAELVKEIALSLDQVLQNINRLNRNLESIITVGNEFSSVEALWSQFEGVMGQKDGDGDGDGDDGEGDGGDEERGDGEDHEEGDGRGRRTRRGEDEDEDYDRRRGRG